MVTQEEIFYCIAVLRTASSRLLETHAMTKPAFMLTSLHPCCNRFSSSTPFPTSGEGKFTKYQFYQQQQRLNAVAVRQVVVFCSTSCRRTERDSPPASPPYSRTPYTIPGPQNW